MNEETIEQALKKLAEMFPDKFGIKGKIVLSQPFTQCDIDSILAEIGWVYEVGSTEGGWCAKIWTDWTKTHYPVCLNGIVKWDTKPEAAKQALIYLVDKINKEDLWQRSIPLD